MLTEFLIGGGTHGAQFASLKRWLQQIGGIHRATRGCSCTDDRVDLVDEQNGVFVLFELGDDGFETFLKVTAIPCASKQRPHVERIYGCVGQDCWGLTSHNLARQAFRYGGFAHAGVAYKQRVVLATAAEHLNAAFHFGIAPDQWVDITLTRLGVQINAVLGKCRFFLFALRFLRLRFFFVFS